MRSSLVLLLAFVASPLAAQGPAPDTLFTRREEMIPMRDGKRLFTVTVIPRNSSAPLPFLMVRTPYGASDNASVQWVARVYGELIPDGYIFVFQDIRGLHGSEGEFVMNRPPRPAGNPHQAAACHHESGEGRQPRERRRRRRARSRCLRR